jgi:hypothetical protein
MERAMWGLERVCPDCRTHLDAASGPARCETCWRIVQLTRRTGARSRTLIDEWARLPPRLQREEMVVRALSTLHWLGGQP